jgi:hypothetical protein
MARIASFKPALTDVDTTPQAALGGLYQLGNRTFKYVKFAGANAVAAGDLVGYVASAGATDQMTTVDGAVGSGPAGIAQAAVATAGGVQYGFIQTRGWAISSAAIAGGAAAGQTLKQGTYPAFTLQTAATIPNAATAFDVTNKIVALTCPD